MSAVEPDLNFIRVDEDAFRACPDESVDYAVMEQTSDAVVVPMDAGWSDVGSGLRYGILAIRRQRVMSSQVMYYPAIPKTASCILNQGF